MDKIYMNILINLCEVKKHHKYNYVHPLGRLVWALSLFECLRYFV